MLPDDPRPLLVLLELALEEGDLTNANIRVEDLERLGDETSSRGRPQDAPILGGEADLAFRLGRAKVLIAEYDASNPSEGLQQDQLQEANALINAVLVDAPGLPSAQMVLAQILERRGNIDEAVAAYERAWENGIEGALPRIIDLLSKRGRYDALTKLRSSPAAGGLTARLDLLSADALVRVGDRTQAGKIAEQLTRECPTRLERHGWQVRMLDHLGKIDDAEASLRAMAERRPGELQPWLNLLDFQSRHHREASAAITEAKIKEQVKIDPPQLLDARIARVKSRSNIAAQAYEAAIAAKPNDLPILLEAGSFYEQAERTTDADRVYRSVLKIDPTNRGSIRQLGVVLARRGTKVAFTQALDVLGPESESNEPADRLARAMVYAAEPHAKGQGRAMVILDDLLADLPANSPLASQARKVFSELLLANNKNAVRRSNRLDLRRRRKRRWGDRALCPSLDPEQEPHRRGVAARPALGHQSRRSPRSEPSRTIDLGSFPTARSRDRRGTCL